METLLERISENPDVISELSTDELTEAKGLLEAAIRDLVTAVKDKTSDDASADLKAAQEAKDRLSVVDERLITIAEADAEVVAEAEKLLEGLTEETPEAEETEEVEDASPEVVVNINNPEGGDIKEEAEEASELVDAITETKEPALVAEGNKFEGKIEAPKVSLGRLAARTPKPETKPALVASAGPAVHSMFPGGLRSVEDFSKAMGEAWTSYGSSKVDAKALVASFNHLDQYKYQVNGDEQHDAEVIDNLMKDIQREAKNNAETATLVASGGICAPSQPLYDFFSIVARDGMVRLPTVGAPRGRITYPVSPSYADVIANTDWDAAIANEHTNADDEAGTSKPNYAVDCPSTATCTIAAYSTILQFGNFANRFYPEFVSNSIDLSGAVADHKVNAALIADMVAASTLTGGGDTGGGGLVNVANLVGFEAAKYRDTYRMPAGAFLDLILPAWVLDALIADLVARNATTSFENAQGRVRALFASLNVNTQFVSDWQSIGDNGDGGFPEAADLMLFAPGTFVRLDEGRLDLGIVRDSTLNSTNDFQTFYETFEAVCEIGHDSWLLDGVVVCPRGSAGADVALDCNPGFNS